MTLSRWRVDRYRATLGWVAALTIAVAWVAVSGRSTDARFTHFQRGICQAVGGSQAAQASNLKLLRLQARRARARAKIDQESGSYLAAQADLDGARLYTAFADQIEAALKHGKHNSFC